MESVSKPEDSVKIIYEVPEPNRGIIIYLIGYLGRLLEPEVQNKTRMDVENYATAFGPCFFNPPEDINLNLEALYSNLQSQKKFVANLLNMRDEVVNISNTDGPLGSDGPMAMTDSKGLSSRAKNLTRSVSTRFSKWQEISMKKAAARRRITADKKKRISDAAKEEREAKMAQEMLAADEQVHPPDATEQEHNDV